MKKLLIIPVLFCSMILSAQEQAQTYIKEAQDLIAKQDYKAAQLSLQDAINELNLLIAKQIAEALPEEINGLKADGEASTNNNAIGAMGGGVAISRSYLNASNSNNEAEITIIANSPMLASLSMFLNNPSMMGEEYKSVRVGTQRAIMKSEMEEVFVADGQPYANIRKTEIQIPLNSTLITIELEGFATEADELSFAGKIDMAKLKLALGE